MSCNLEDNCYTIRVDRFISSQLDRNVNAESSKMSRLKKIDPEAAVQAAMALFWQHGYSGLGTRQLEEETGITRFTLQTSYGGKKSLFLKALDTYLDVFEAHLCPNMSDGEMEAIAVWFEQRIEPSNLPDAANYGCLLLNSTVEFAAEDGDVNLRAERFFNMMRGGFNAALSAAKDKGNLPPDFDIAAMAEVLLSGAIGLNIVIRAAAANSAGKNMAYSIASMVRGWATN